MKFLKDSEFIYGLKLYELYPKPIKLNTTVNSLFFLIVFYNSKNSKGQPLYKSMQKERMLSILFQIVNSVKEGPETKKRAAKMFSNLLQGID